ncbi:MAG TPA: hypothetical protein DCS09_08540 [Porphyromonadaceae bacterium]|nr:hypothetical protein [Porphyromonadaceae bacterium]
MREKPIVGQTLYSLNVGNAARNTTQELTEVVVTKVGRKFFYCAKEEWKESDDCWTKYDLDTWRQVTNYSATSSLYKTVGEYADEKECTILSAIISDAFRYGRNVKNISLPVLRDIAAMIQKEEDSLTP